MMEAFTAEQVLTFLEQRCPDLGPDQIQIIRNARVTGNRAAKWSDTDWRNMGLPYGDVCDITSAINDYKNGRVTFNLSSLPLPVSNSVPEVTNSVPEVTKSVPEVTKSVPEVTKSVPEVTNSVPEVRTPGGGSCWSRCTFISDAMTRLVFNDNSRKDDDDDEDEDNRDFSSIAKFFPHEEFKIMGPYEKMTYLNRKEHYERAINAGLKVGMPDFMKRKSNAGSSKQKPTAASSRSSKQMPTAASPSSNKQMPTAASPSSSIQMPTAASPSSSIQTPTAPSSSSSKEMPITAGARGTATLKKKSAKKCSKVKLTEAELAASLPKFDVPAILEKGKERLMKGLRQKLATDGIVYDKERKLMMRTLTKWLHYEHVREIKLVSMDMKEGLAFSIVEAYPKFKDYHPTKPSWWRLLDREGPSGFIANCSINILRNADPSERPRGGGKRGKKRSRDSSNDEDEGDSGEEDKENRYVDKDAGWMNFTMPCATNKSSLLKGMQDSFPVRNKWIKEANPSVSEVLEKYLHLMSFGGEMLVQEFELLYPEKGHLFTRNFPLLIEKFTDSLSGIDVEIELEENESRVLKTCLFVGKSLPRPNLTRYRRSQRYGQSESIMPQVETLVHIIPAGCNVETIVRERRANAKGPVQPYLLALVPDKKITKQFIVADSKFIELHSSSLIYGLDLLFKTYHIFNVEYPLGWKPFWELTEHGLVGLKKHNLPSAAKELLSRHGLEFSF